MQHHPVIAADEGAEGRSSVFHVWVFGFRFLPVASVLKPKAYLPPP